MKKLVVPLTLFLLLAGVLLSGCGKSAEEIVKEAIRASKEQKSASFKMEQDIKLPRAPITDGQLATQEFIQNSEGEVDLRTGDALVMTELAPGVPVSMLMIGDKQYWQLAGNWYEVPQAQQVQSTITETLSISQYLQYFKEMKKLGDVNIDGQDCYHVRGLPDMSEMIKLPGVTDLLKDPQGNQIRTVDEVEEMKFVCDFYIMKSNYYIKQFNGQIEFRAGEDFIKHGYAEAGDMIKADSSIIFSNFDKNLNLKAPENAQPLPVQQPAQ
ncbi:MAG: LppX_LprAFG lipoprotein [Actinobacteria bacterium]|nr:LppX_LprAFG lipoprotein [Actinomycetota bacterium]